MNSRDWQKWQNIATTDTTAPQVERMERCDVTRAEPEARATPGGHRKKLHATASTSRWNKVNEQGAINGGQTDREEPDSPDVVVFTKYHAGLREARPADLAEMRLTTGALETARVPVPLHGVQQEAVDDLSATSSAHLRHGAAVIVVVIVTYSRADRVVVVVVVIVHPRLPVVVQRRHQVGGARRADAAADATSGSVHRARRRVSRRRDPVRLVAVLIATRWRPRAVFRQRVCRVSRYRQSVRTSGLCPRTHGEVSGVSTGRGVNAACRHHGGIYGKMNV